jgi:hypothetical protein
LRQDLHRLMKNFDLTLLKMHYPNYHINHDRNDPFYHRLCFAKWCAGKKWDNCSRFSLSIARNEMRRKRAQATSEVRGENENLTNIISCQCRMAKAFPEI